MKRFFFLLLTLFLFALTGCSQQQHLEDSWGVALPENGEFAYFLRESDSVYGSRYSVYRYDEDNSKVAAWCIWEKSELVTVNGDTAAEAAQSYIRNMDIPAEYQTDFSKAFCWYKELDGNELFLFWHNNGNMVYAVEHFRNPVMDQ